ncbi:XRE family transcriptional regulator [Enterococcus phage Bp29]|uniref:Uncharacterized protein n=1 Tax=Enterococcus phage vB_EfaS-DELF1 TaxID=2683673 RepID=A0A5S9MMC5_9CAUD|nr:XRE family transcriptional regulator [Enterococcus phage Bp29]BBQ04333.1 hypothetical protein [Enterococcus phage vB_EfaS-DELF1]
MKVTFNGTPRQVRQEMEQWLSNNQVDTNINDRVLLQLTKHGLKLTNSETDTIPVSVVKQTCQLKGNEWLEFLRQLEQLGVKKKRTSKSRILTNLELIKED